MNEIQEINTFSSAVDMVISRSGRKDRLNDIVGFTKQTIREIQSLSKFSSDLIEDQITTSGIGINGSFLWTKPNNLRSVRTVRYPAILDPQGLPVFPKYVRPGKKQNGKDHFYYLGPTYIGFSNLSDNTLIDIAYYSYARSFYYFTTPDDRPARFLFDTTLDDFLWTYKSANTDEEKLAAEEKVTNWVLFNWFEAVIEGSLAKVLKIVGDDRAISSFALYKSYQKDVLVTEMNESDGV